MAFSMSGVEDGYSYNRFDLYEKKGKKKDCGCSHGASSDKEEGEGGEAVSEAMDPVGKEDGDVNNDGKKDSSDSYLMNRRKAIAKAMKKEEAELEMFSEKELDALEEMFSEGDFPKDAPSIKDAKPAKKTDVKMYKGLGMAPVVKKEDAEESYTAAYMEGYKELPKAKMQDKAAMKPDTARGEKQARTMDTVRKATEMAPDEVKGAVKGREMDNKKSGLERKYNAPSADGANTKKMKNTAYKLENQRRKDLDKRYGPKKEELEQYGMFSEQEIDKIIENMFYGEEDSLGKSEALVEKEISIDDQMKISREAAKGRNPNPDHKAIRGKMLKKPLPKDNRSDDQKMTDAVGKPRMGSSD